MKPAFKVYGNLNGKMAGISHISVAAGESGVCKGCEMKNICYAQRYQRLRPSVLASYKRNGEILTSQVFGMYDIPYVTTLACRFNAFGELYTGEKGRNQLINYILTAIKNPDTTFVLWSRNYKLVESYFKKHPKPVNMKLIRSTETVDSPVQTIPAGWDGVFNVITKEFAEKNEIVVNCGTKDEFGEKIGCARCSTGCYKPGVNVICYELVK
jgi:hypothetical protein